MTREEFLKLLEDNPELKSVVLNKETVSSYLESGSTEAQSVVDRFVQKGITSFKEKGMQSILDAKKDSWKEELYQEFAKEHDIEMNPQVREIQSKMAELEKKIAQAELDKTRNEAVANVTSKLAEKKLSTKLANFLNITNTEEALTQVDTLSELIDGMVQERVTAKLKENSTTPGSGRTGNPDENPWSKDKFNLTKQAEILKSDPARAKELQELASN